MTPAEPAEAPAEAAPAPDDDADIVRRPAKRLAECLACDICTGLLIEPLTATECMHCFCRECITAFLAPGQSAVCPVCRAEGVTTAFGNQPFKDQLRVDFMLTDLLRKLSGQLAAVAMRRETRVAQWHALSREITGRASPAAEPALKPLKQLPPDGAGCVELFISAPEDHELEQPYVRLHEGVTVALLTRFLRERILSMGQDDISLRLECRGQRLAADMKLGEVEAQLWRPHARDGQPLHIAMDWRATPEPQPAPA